MDTIAERRHPEPPAVPRSLNFAPSNIVQRELLNRARGEFRRGYLSADELQAAEQNFLIILSDEHAEAFERACAAPRLQAVREALADIDRIARVSNGIATTNDRMYVAWSELARVVRERADIPELLAIAGFEMKRVGKSSRRNADEFAGECPMCGGTDRLRAWSGPNARAWCRQCRWSADAIAITRSFIVRSGGFRDAVRYLAELMGADRGVTQ